MGPHLSEPTGANGTRTYPNPLGQTALAPPTEPITRLTVRPRFPIIHLLVGAWLSLVERSVRDREVGGSNPLAPTKNLNPLIT